MRDEVRVLHVEKLGEGGRLAAVMRVSVAVNGSALMLSGVGLMRSGSALRVTYPHYRHPGSHGPSYAFEPTGNLRKSIEEAVLNHWSDVYGAEAKTNARRVVARAVADEPPPVRQLALR